MNGATHTHTVQIGLHLSESAPDNLLQACLGLVFPVIPEPVKLTININCFTFWVSIAGTMEQGSHNTNTDGRKASTSTSRNNVKKWLREEKNFPSMVLDQENE